MQQDIRISDEQLVERIREGRTTDFALLVHRHAPSLLHFVGRMLPVQEEAEEVVQDAMLSAYQRLGDFDASRAPFAVWLKRIAFNTTTHRLRVRRPQFVPMDEHHAEAGPTESDELDRLLADGKPDRTELLDKALELLSAEERMLIHLFYTDERPLREISFILDCSVTALTSRLHRIRKKLYVTINRLSNEYQRRP